MPATRRSRNTAHAVGSMFFPLTEGSAFLEPRVWLGPVLFYFGTRLREGFGTCAEAAHAMSIIRALAASSRKGLICGTHPTFRSSAAEARAGRILVVKTDSESVGEL